jgi:hypothetical protein
VRTAVASPCIPGVSTNRLQRRVSGSPRLGSPQKGQEYGPEVEGRIEEGKAPASPAVFRCKIPNTIPAFRCNNADSTASVNAG